MQPVVDDGSTPYASSKLGQVLLGGALGSVAAPTVNALTGALSRQMVRVQNMVNKPDPSKVLQDALAEAGIRAEEIGAKQLDALRGQIKDALRTGKTADPAAMLREQDFSELGLAGTKGQVLRDPMQFSREKNLSNLDGVGSPLKARFIEQDRVLRSRLEAFGDGAAEPIEANRQVVGQLGLLDRAMSKQVSGMYKAAEPLGGDQVATTGLAQDAARIIDDYREKVPGGVVSRLRSYGFLDGKQTKSFDFNEAESLIRLINSHGNKIDRAEGAALGELREAVKRAIVEDAGNGGPYAPARKAASDRFKLHDAIPALKKVAEGGLEPDGFIDKYVIRAPVEQVKGMADLLDKDSLQEVRKQIGEHLRRAAVRDDVVGDRAISVNGYNNALRKLGTERLRAFFSADELDELRRIGRVAAYKDSDPANAAVNRSNTTSALFNLMRSTGGGVFNAPLLNVVSDIGHRYGTSRDVGEALAGGLMSHRPNLSEAAMGRVGLLSGMGAVSGGLLGDDAGKAAGGLLFRGR